MNNKLYYKGYTLIFAIVVIIIVTSVALLFLSYFQINYIVLNGAENYSVSRMYCYNGFNLLNTTPAYNELHEVNLPEGWRLEMLKQKWGVYDLYYSTVIKNSKDTLHSKIALLGFQKDTTVGLSLYLRRTNDPLSIGDSVSITGACYVPQAVINTYHKSDKYTIEKKQLYASVDTIVRLHDIDSVIAWATNIPLEATAKKIIVDSQNVSFHNKTVYINADSVFISGSLKGNIIVRAKYVKVLPPALLSDIIIICNDVIFPDNFKGQLQVFASASIDIGSSATFNYPSVLALLPETGSVPPNSGEHYYINTGDSFHISGEIYAYAFSYPVSQKMFAHFSTNAKVAGSIYSTGAITWEGSCHGCIICEKLLNDNGNTLKANFMKSSTIDSISPVFSYSTLFPYRGQKKIVRWEK